MPIIISRKIQEKLIEKHGVSVREVAQCFDNVFGSFLIDTREVHRSDPPTLWFIAPTNKDRLLKVCFIQKGEDIYIRTAYEPNIDELNIYISKLP